MTTNHYNQLTESEQERLVLLIEECGEVIQCGTKILRHGYESNNRGAIPETNREALQRELYDLIHAIGRLKLENDINWPQLVNRQPKSKESTELYIHHNAWIPGLPDLFRA